MLAAAGLVAAGCAGTTALPGTPSRPGTAAQPRDWTTFAAEVTGVRPGPDPRTALVDVSLPAGHPDCARNPHVTYLEEESGRVYANIVFESARAQQVGGCPQQAPAAVALTAAGPLAGRDIVLNSMSTWTAGQPGYRRCDSQLGCRPPADHCDPTWVIAAVSGMDVPQHSSRDVLHCDRSWLIMEINTSAGACGPVEGQRPSCSAPPRITRWFLRFDNGWHTVAGTRRAGCRDVRAAEPAFPERLCRGLPAVR